MLITWSAAKAPIKVSASYQEVYSLGDIDGVQPIQQRTARERTIGEPANVISCGQLFGCKNGHQV